MSSDNDSEIECWDAEKPSTSNPSRATKVAPARGAYNADVELSCRSTQPSPESTRKRKLLDMLSALHRQVPSHKSPPSRHADSDLIDLTEDNIDVDIPNGHDSDSESSSDTEVEQELPSAKAAAAKRVGDVAFRKPASSFVEKPTWPSLSRHSKSSQQSALKAQHDDVIDLTFDEDDSSVDSRHGPPPSESEKSAAAPSHINLTSAKAPSADDSSSSEGSRLKTKASTPKKLNYRQSSDESSRLSGSSLGVGVKNKASLAIIKAARPRRNFYRDDDDSDSNFSSIASQNKESDNGAKNPDTRVEIVIDLFDNDDSDTFFPSIATQNAASQSHGDENDSQAERHALRGSMSGSMKSVTDSPAWSDTSASMVDEKLEVGNMKPNQSNGLSDMMTSHKSMSKSLIKRVRPCKGTRTSAPRAEIDDNDPDWHASLSVGSEMSGQRNECSTTTTEKRNISERVRKRVRSCKSTRTAAPKTYIDVIDIAWNASSSVPSEMSYQRNDHSEIRTDIRNMSKGIIRQLRPCKGTRAAATETIIDNVDIDWKRSSFVGQPNECSDNTAGQRTNAGKEKLTPHRGLQPIRPLVESDEIDSDWNGSSSVRSDVSNQLNESSVRITDKRNTPSSVLKQVWPLKGAERLVVETEEIDSDWDTDVSQEFEENEVDFAACLASVCRATGTNGHPIRYYSVYGGDDDVLYDFRLFVDKSNIPNAGMGAFLTYMGARKINKDSATHKLCTDLFVDYDYEEPETLSHLVAIMPDGMTKTVKLDGDNLHANYNCIYYPSTKRDQRKTLSTKINDKKIRIKVVGECLDTFHELKDRPKDGIGHLGMYREEDYEHVSGVHCNSDLLIELDAPYAPLSPSDRKTATLFDIKSFLFDNEPSAWAFDVEENILGQLQICDITDDMTGEPHVYARAEIPMYVNEVGHSGVEANVYVKETQNRIPKYFIKLNKTIKPGETVELLTDYKKQYEGIRVRKGYGLKNIHRDDKSDKDPATRLNRNIDLRSTIEKLCSTLSLPELTRVLNYVSKKVWVPFCELLRINATEFPEGACLLSPIQWVAFLRIIWFQNQARTRLGHLVKALDKGSMTNLFCGEFIRECSTSLDSIRFPSDVSLFDFLNQVEMSRNLKNEVLKASGAISQELVEQFYYDLRDCIRHPFLTNMWCPLGVNVLNRLGRYYAKLKLKYLERSQTVDRSELAKLLISEAAASSLDMDIAETTAFEFSSGTTCERISFELLQRILGKGKVEKSTALIKTNDKTPKALHALAYTYLYEKRKFNANENVVLSPHKKFLVLCATNEVGSLESFVAEVGSTESNQESAWMQSCRE
ncbi:hypothetical protein FisN_10Lh112 [Fistulifera solaris]|uniref:SET domain-containing protein n=1 Tax=Fistulifera solaris TaxID=1519565 RepID=A0A1Z5JT91_FISSO|nr:hypothetical protein FisN_10Lh112 [Fistulifera solaris]|eukprot:GAX17254.1 hypothetical protein FisN_10Lh112 [Fistulifera solaris]